MDRIHRLLRIGFSRIARYTMVCSLLPLSSGMLGCDDGAPPYDPSENAEPAVADNILDGLRTQGDWERAPHQVKWAVRPLEDEAFSTTQAEDAAAATAADEDPTWYAEDGSRYQALFVMPDGATYGRRGAAPTAPETPSEENGFFAWKGVDEGQGADSDDGGAEGSVYTDVSHDERTRFTHVFPFFGMSTFPKRVSGAMSSNGNTMSNGCSGAKSALAPS